MHLLGVLPEEIFHLNLAGIFSAKNFQKPLLFGGPQTLQSAAQLVP
jgi:hypothetical protein